MTDPFDAGGFLITGVMASGKSTIADLLVRRFDHGVHLRGDVFRTMIVTGRDPIEPSLGREARRQLDLRKRLAAMVANEYWRDGFTVVLQDIVAGETLPEVIDLLEISPLFVVVLAARPEVVARRERDRPKTGYVNGWEVNALVAMFEETTPRRGLWLDSSDLSPAATVEAILTRCEEARVK
ncbi:MAG: AAA family ATPase [Acidimicrobiales bacterium]